MTLCSIVIPVFGQSALTAQCLNALLANPPGVDFEIVVVDDASSDATEEILAGFGESIRVVRHEQNLGFAASCNDGAAAAGGSYIVFLNNDTIPQEGWLDALVGYAERTPEAAVVGSKLLFPDGTIQHAGVIVADEGFMRHLYAGFPADHPVVNKSRRFQIVTGACALVRRGPFEQAGGFDTAFRNSFEDVDLCLRLGELGHEVHYCHESVVYHFESASEGRFDDIDENERLFRERWAERLKPDDLRYWLEDGLLEVSYPGVYPVVFRVSPLLAYVLHEEERDRYAELLLAERARQAYELVQEAARLEARARAAELVAAGGNGQGLPPVERLPRLLAEAELHWLEGEPGGPLVSVLIEVGAEAPGLERQLEALLGQQTRACLELLALGFGVGAEGVALLRRFGVGLLSFDEVPCGLARARSLAVSQLRGELVVLLGAGVVPADSGWLAPLLAPLLNEQGVAAVSSRLLPAPEADPLARRRLLAQASSGEVPVRLAADQPRPLPFQSESVALPGHVLAGQPPPEQGGDPAWAEQLLQAGLQLQHEPASVAFALSPEPARNGEAAELLELLREDWRFLERECSLSPGELEEWRARAALRRAGELLAL